MRLAYKKIRNDTDFDLKEFKERLEADRTFIDEEGKQERKTFQRPVIPATS